MGDKYSKYDLKDLTYKYFEFDSELGRLNQQKNEIDEEIMNQYNERLKVYNLIKEKQNEEDEIRKQNYIKYGLKVKLEDNEQLNRNYGMTLSELKNAK